MIIFGIIFVIIGIILTKYPINALDFSMMFTVKGRIEYTDFAIRQTIFAGIALIIIGIAVIYMDFTNPLFG